MPLDGLIKPLHGIDGFDFADLQRDVKFSLYPYNDPDMGKAVPVADVGLLGRHCDDQIVFLQFPAKDIGQSTEKLIFSDHG